MSASSSSRSTSDRPDILGQMAGEYRLLKQLGEGGFGTVYLAEHPVLKRRAAVKVLHRVAGMDSEAVQRFISEAQAVNQIRSRHIIDIFSFGMLADGRHFYVMDLLEGEPLDRYLARETRCEVAAAIGLLRPIAEALDSAHRAGIVHRDLKPQNIFLVWAANGETVPKLLDFGLAKLLGQSSVHTVSGTPMGTPLYMSPEQAMGEKVDARSDVYALGVLCYELLTGRRPITGESAVAVLMAHITQPAARLSEVCPDLPSDLDGPVLRMLEKKLTARPSSAGEAVAELERAAESAGYSVPPGAPHLPRPVISAEDRAEADFPNTAGVRDAQSERETMVRSAQAGARKPGLSWLISGLLLVVGVGAAAYLVMTVLHAPAVHNGAGVGALSRSAEPLATGHRAPTPPPGVSAKPESPKTVVMTLQGTPRGARVLLNGQGIGEVPGPLTLPFGRAPVALTVTAPGYEPTTLMVVPDRISDASVKLRKRAGAGARRDSVPSDLESPF